MALVDEGVAVAERDLFDQPRPSRTFLQRVACDRAAVAWRFMPTLARPEVDLLDGLSVRPAVLADGSEVAA